MRFVALALICLVPGLAAGAHAADAPLQIAVPPAVIPPSTVPGPVTADRHAGGLTVPVSPVFRADAGGRMRSHVDGSLSGRSTRRWVGPPVPPYVELTLGIEELFLLDPLPASDGIGGHLAVYREPYDLRQTGGCGSVETWENCGFTARLYGADGAILWTLPLDPLFSRPRNLELQDIRFDAGVLYFNEACASYAADAKGRCSALVAVEPASGQAVFRSPPLTSNGRFVLLPEVILCGYGFTAEPDFVYLLDRKTGQRLDRLPVRTAPERYTPVGDDTFAIRLYDDSEVTVQVERRPGKSPRLKRLRVKAK